MALAHPSPFSRAGTPHPQCQLGWVGLGNMGLPMAINLQKSLSERQPPLPPLVVYNRTRSKAKPLEDMGCICVDSPEEVGARCDLVFTSLSNDAVAREIYAQLFKGQERSTAGHGYAENASLYVDTSTLYPTTAGELERLASAVPYRHFLSCPVFGPPPMAREAKLVWAVSGSYHAKKFVAQFLVPAMGRKIMDLGSNVERAASFKLIGNAMILSTIEMLAESMTLADKTGVGADKLYEWVREFFPAPSAIGYGNKILTNQFSSEEGFSLSGGIKDATHIRKLAESVDCPLPIIDIAHQHMVAARANGGSNLDWSSLVGGQRIASGLKPFTTEDFLLRQRPDVSGKQDEDEAA